MSVVYSPLKVFGFPHHIASTNGPLRAPIHVRIKPVNACNQRCWFCAYREDALALGSDMNARDRIPAEKMREITQDLIVMGVRAVTFSGGGEPLIYPFLPDAIRSFGQAGVQVATLTNGWRLRGEVADTLAEHATWVRVSIDAWDGVSYAKSRGVPVDAFDRVIANVERFTALSDRCSVGFSFIVTADNAAHIAEFCALAKAVGARHVKISACIVANEAVVNEAYHAPLAEKVKAQIVEAQRLEDEAFTIVDHYHSLAQTFQRPYRTCPMLEYVTVIGADCSVYACQDKAYTSSGFLGSIRDRRFRELWYSWELAAHVRSIDPRMSCTHHCTAHAKNTLIAEYRNLDPDHAAFV